MQLTHLTDKTLLADTKFLATRERELTTKILWHIKEIETRNLYSELKYSSMFTYLTQELGYSEGSAQRRLQVARALKHTPEIEKKIEEGVLNLGTVSMIEGQKFSTEKKQELFKEAENKTRREVEQMILKEKGQEQVPEKEKIKPVSTTQHELKLTIDEETLKLIEDLKNLKPNKALKEILKEALKDSKSITEKKKFKTTSTATVAATTKRVPTTAMKRDVYLRDKKCQNCGSTYALEYDHLVPWAFGGMTTPENLRILCRNCNQRSAHAALLSKIVSKENRAGLVKA